MASKITIKVTPTDRESIPVGAVRRHVRMVREEDLSVSSPVSDGAPEAGVRSADDGSVLVVVDGHEGEFTKTSQDALLSAATNIPYNAEGEVIEGGYETED